MSSSSYTNVHFSLIARKNNENRHLPVHARIRKPGWRHNKICLQPSSLLISHLSNVRVFTVICTFWNYEKKKILTYVSLDTESAALYLWKVCRLLWRLPGGWQQCRRGNVRVNGQVCGGLTSLFPYGLSHVEVLICSPSLLLSWCMCCQYHCRPTPQCPPTTTSLCDQPLPSVLAPLHSVPSSFSLYLPVFCALSSLPPALSVPVQPSSLFTPWLPFPLWWCPLTPHPFRPPCPPSCWQGPQIFLFFSWLVPLKVFLVANNCCQQAPHKIPAWMLLSGPQWNTGSNGH